MRRWLLYSNIHIVPVSAGFVLGTYALAGVPANSAYVVLATCGAFLVYQWDRVSGFSPEDEINVPERRQWLLERPVYLLLSTLAAFAGAVWALSVSSDLVRISAIVLGVIGTGYALPFVFGRRPKDLSRFKNVLVAGCWLGGGVVIPLLEASAGTAFVVWLCTYRLAYIVPDLAVAAAADRPGDVAMGLREGATLRNVSPLRSARGAFLCAVALVLMFLLAGRVMEDGPLVTGSIVFVVDLVGIAGAYGTVRGLDTFEYRHVIAMDAWVAFPLVTWMVSSLL